MSTSRSTKNPISASIVVPSPISVTTHACSSQKEGTTEPVGNDRIVRDGTRPQRCDDGHILQAVRMSKCAVSGIASNSRCRGGGHGNSSGRPSLPRYQLLQPVTQTV